MILTIILLLLLIITIQKQTFKNMKQISEDELREGLKIAGFPTSDGELTKV